MRPTLLLLLTACASDPTPSTFRWTNEGFTTPESPMRLRSTSWGRADEHIRLPTISPTLHPDGATYTHDGVEEWWLTLAVGVEQGWTITTRPPGTGDLELLVSVENATATGGGDAAWLDDGKRRWRYGDAWAQDADGEALPIDIRVVNGNLVVRVDDTGARYPLTIDPTLTATSWFIESNVANTTFGNKVTGAGDANNDGYDDLLVAAGYLDGGNTNEGGAYLYLGSAAGPDETADWTYEGNADNVRLGTGLAWAGDVNHDGYDDVIVGAPFVSNGHSYEGNARVFLGSSSGLASSPVWTGEGNATDAFFGFAVASAGDTNNDGYDDILVGAYDYTNGQTHEGIAYLYKGSATGPGTSAAWSQEGNIASALFGATVRGIGDMDADGYDDVVVGMPGYSSSRGRVYLYEGSSTGLSSTAAWYYGSSTAYDYLPTDLGGGDIDGDGFADLVVGDGDADAASSNGGKVLLFYGSAGTPSSAPDWTYQGTQRDAYVGRQLSIGDYDGDGYDDIAAGAPYYEDGETNEGSVFLFLGGATGPGSSPDESVSSNVNTAEMSSGMGPAGDLNGDGSDDLAVGGAWYSNPEAGEGAVWIWNGVTPPSDLDGDGYAATAGDCDDSDPAVSPAAIEVCNDIDDDCDTNVDESLRTTYYADSDGDGFGSTTTTTACSKPPGYATVGGDCDDTLASSHPGGTEVCNDEDDDCDGSVDEAVLNTYWKDGDGDGYGTTPTVDGCSLPGGYAAVGGDCDDTTSSRSPGATEVCNAADDDCDGTADDGIMSTWWLDADGDGYGTGAPYEACAHPVDHAAADGDCDDTDAAANPGATEVPGNGIDDDCDGTERCHVDSDGDGYGLSGTVSSDDLDCGDAGEAVVSGDCSDTTPTIHPGATEVVADGIDQDCDGGDRCQVDGDGDGHGASATIDGADLDCADTGESASDDDCDDSAATVYPGATDTPGDGIDANCDGGESCYADADHDGHGVATPITSADLDCGDVGEASTSDDCDDASASVHPGAIEVVGDSIDEDCSGSERCYVDEDGDGYGLSTELDSTDDDCLDHGEAPVDGDCDDTCASCAPGLTEGIADGIDGDCDGAELCFVDADGDGYGSTETSAGALDCGDAGLSTSPDDCDDASAEVFPGGEEIAGDTIDGDCDGSEVCFHDRDADGHGAGEAEPSYDLDCTTAGWSTLGDDCNDSSSAAYPGAAETPLDGIDQDCDGGELCYEDADGDDYGTDALVSGDLNCAGDGVATRTGDCSDSSSAIHPGAAELVADGVDEDCDGGELCQVDADGDGAGGAETVASTDLACDGAGEAAAADDCDDGEAAVFPGAAEVCNEVDDDCDGDVDNGAACDSKQDTGEAGSTGCGCATGADAPGPVVLAGLLALLGLRRRNGKSQ